MLKKFGYNLPKLDTPNFKTIVKDPLTKTESEILDDLKEGLSSKEIAEKRFISETTVKTHINGIYTKKQVHNMQQLLVKEFNDGKQNKMTNIMQGLKILNMKL
jgi:DNA-binding NarL/FixJ family response regulator